MNGSLYKPGHSWLHRMPAGRKLLVLIAMGTGLLFVHRLSILAGASLFVSVLIFHAGIPFKKLWIQLRAMIWFLLILGLYSAWVESPGAAVEMLLRLITLILGALLVSMTTPITQMMGIVEWLLAPIARLGWVDARKVSLTIGLTLRLIPELSVQWNDIREAQAARGVKPGVITMLFPMLLRTLRRAEELSEAIDARSLN